MALLAVLVTTLVAGARTDSSASTPPPSLEHAPAFSLADVRDPSATVAFTGAPDKPTVINFFASWCVPCRDELPYFVEEAEARPGVEFIGVDVRDIRADAVALMDEADVSFPSGWDPRSEVARSYGAIGMPLTVFVAPGGRVTAVQQGPISHRELRDQLDLLEEA